MKGAVLEFAACCRANGMRVSTAEVLDCLALLPCVFPLDEPGFHGVLKANFAKSRREQEAFERLYHLFFRNLSPEPAETLDRQPPAREAGDLEQAMTLMARDQAWDNEVDQALGEFMAGNPKAFIQMVRQIHDQESSGARAVKSNLGQLTRRLEILMAAGRMRERVARFLGSLDAAVDPAPKGLGLRASQRLDQAIAFLNADPRPHNEGLRQGGGGQDYFPDLGEVPFANLTQAEMTRVREVVDPWVKKLKEISVLRFAAARKGMVDVKKTIHRSGRYLGVPIEIVKKDKPLRKAKIVTLCDVSGSVWSTARFMLSILYALQICFSRVKSYVFIDRPLEVTPLFLAHDANTAVKKILKDPRLNYNARTDYGLTFQEFARDHMGVLDKKTTLILLGDARSNYLNPREPVLESLREHCRRLVWLNPEQERFWGTGDSEMLRYRDYCNEARPCGNLNQLIDFMQELIL